MDFAEMHHAALTSLDPRTFLENPEYAVIGVKRRVVEMLFR